MAFKEHKLEFFEDRIIDLESGSFEVMMSWELPLMREHAKVACHNQGDVLEIGFGMGISATEIQKLNPKSHTIIEPHPQILEKLYKWSADKANVHIIEGEWYKVLDQLEKYDGIFFDPIHDDDYSKFPDVVSSLIKPGAKVTFWNPSHNSGNKSCIYAALQRAMTEKFTGFYAKTSINPPKNSYFSNKEYFVPIVSFPENKKKSFKER